MGLIGATLDVARILQEGLLVYSFILSIIYFHRLLVAVLQTIAVGLWGDTEPAFRVGTMVAFLLLSRTMQPADDCFRVSC